MTACKRIVLVALGGAALFAAAPAAAQIPTPSPGIYAPDYATLISQGTFLRQGLGQPGRGAVGDRRDGKRGRRDKHHARDRRKHRPTARQRATLRFEPSADVQAAVDRTFAESFGAPGVPAETVLADLTRLRATMAGDIQRAGWRTDDLGDVAAYALLIGYAVVNEETTVPKKGAAAVRRAVRDVLAGTRAVRRLPDAEQQEFAETLVLRVAYNIGEANGLAAAGDTEAAAESRERLRDFVRSVFGVDVTATRLTDRGLVKRRRT